MQRVALLAFLVLALAGCGGGDDPAPAGSGQDPAAALPPDMPISVTFDADLSSDQWESALAFAERLDPGERDLAPVLREELGGEEVSFEEDIEPWLGDALTVGVRDVEEEVYVVAVATTDEAATRETLAKSNEESKPATYDGVDYAVDDEGEATAVVEGYLIGASDEQELKAAIDAVRGESLADSDRYRDALADVPEDALAHAYADQDAALEVLERSGAVPPSTIESAKSAEGYEPGQAYAASLGAEEGEMTFELTGPATAGAAEGPELADLPGGAWLALAGALPEEFATEFSKSFEATAPQAGPILDDFGIVPFLEGVEDVTLRVGGTSIESLNGAFALTGTDADATRTLFERAVAALRREGAPVQVEGNTATLAIPPFSARLVADGGSLRLEAGEQPEGDLADDESYSGAADALGLDHVVLFVDFASLEEFVRALPQDGDVEDALPTLAELGTLIAGSEVSDDTTRARVVLSLR